jgi:hypothetical protein
MSIHFELDTFKELIETYPVWEDLQKYLESSEGGLFRIVDRDENGLCLIRYEKGVSKMNLAHSKWFRSVVWNTNTNRPVCVAPSKAESQDISLNTIQEVLDAGIVCQEYLEGFMINCCRVAGSDKLYITSRSKLNAAGKFYSQKSFRELFIEAYLDTKQGVKCDNYNEADIQTDQNIKYPDESNNEIATYYSFLVQHTEHRIVKKNTENRVYLIHSGTVFNDGSIKMIDSPLVFFDKTNIENIPIKLVKGSYAQIAATASDQTELNKWIKQMFQDNSWQYQGIVLKDNKGNRWRYRSEKYSAVKTLRGNSANIMERFAQLYTQNLIMKYLEYYDEEAMMMTFKLMFFDAIIKTMYNNYVDLHITKCITVNEIEKAYLPHLYSIHGIYLSQLRPNGKKVTVEEIQQYFHKQPWQRIVFLIKKVIESVNADIQENTE